MMNGGISTVLELPDRSQGAPVNAYGFLLNQNANDMKTESDLKLELLVNAPLVSDEQILEYMNLTLAEVMAFCEYKTKWWNENKKAIKEGTGQRF